jgi:hypothetical protein
MATATATATASIPPPSSSAAAAAAAAYSTRAQIHYLERLDLYKKEKAYEVSFEPLNVERPGVRISNVSLKPHPVTIRSFSASCREDFSTDVQGFELEKFPTGLSTTQLMDLETIEGLYHEAAVKFLKGKFGARKVAIFDTTIRQTRNKAFDTSASLLNKQILGPALGCHVDQSPDSVNRRIKHLFPEKAEQLLQSRVRVINIWRPLVWPRNTSPLALCDFRSTRQDDYVPCDLKTPVWDGESLQVHHSPAHEWWFAEEMAEDDVVLIKMYDSEAWKPGSGIAMCTPHCAFAWDDAPEGTQDRESMEIRAIVFS